MVSRPVYRPLPALALALPLLAPVACEDSSSRLEAHMSRGDGYLEEEKFCEATLEYKNVVRIDPNHADAHYRLARALLGNGQLPRPTGRSRRRCGSTRPTSMRSCSTARSSCCLGRARTRSRPWPAPTR